MERRTKAADDDSDTETELEDAPSAVSLPSVLTGSREEAALTGC
jgi:hypothetical protein